MRTLRLAISFLTIFPLYGNRVAGDKEMAQSLFGYPLVGFIIGALLGLTAYLANFLSLGLAGNVLVIVLWILLTGGLHLDGLMDTADGLFSGRERRRKLEIMKDSRVGAMGAIALVSLLLLKVSFLNLLSPSLEYRVLLVAPALGRAMMVYPILYYPYARSEGGLGQSFGSQVSRLAFPAALVTALAGGWLAGGLQILVCMLVVGILVSLLAGRISAVLDGHTGDTYGALCEVTETLFIITAVLAVHWR